MTGAFFTIADMGFDAGFLILVVIAARLLLFKAPKSAACLLWALVAARLLMPFPVQSAFSLVPEVSGILNVFSERTAGVADQGNGGADAGTGANGAAQNTDAGAVYFKGQPLAQWRAQNAQPSLWSNAADGTAEDGTSAQNGGESAEDGYTDSVFAQMLYALCGRDAERFPKIAQTVAAVWLAGVAVMLSYLFASMVLLRQKVSARILLRENIYICDEIKGPFVLGVFRPVICIPSGMEEATVESVLCHERAHLRRKDQIWKPLGFVILSVYWFLPLCWAAYLLFCRDTEFACDERAVRGMDVSRRADYCQALLDCSKNRRSRSVCPVAFGEIGAKKRIKAVIGYKKPTFWAVLAAVVICAVVAVCFFTSPKRDGGAVADTETAAATETVSGDIFSDAAADGELSFEELIAMVKDDAWTSYVAEHDIRYWRQFANMEDSETSAVTAEGGSNKTLRAEYVYGQRSYLFAVAYAPEEYAKQLGAEADSVQSIYLFTSDGKEELWLYRAGVDFSAVTDIDGFLQDTAWTSATQAQLEMFFENWAGAFIRRDGADIRKYATTQTQEALEKCGLLDGNSFGVPSPWPWTDDACTISVNQKAGTNDAEILYYAMTSDPHLTVWKEKLYYTYDLKEGQYYIVSEDLFYYDAVASGGEFAEAYAGGISGTYMDYETNGLGGLLNENAMEDATRYPLFEPADAARNLLNLSDDVSVEDVAGTSSYYVTEKLNFAEDGGVVYVAMTKPWGGDGIWIPKSWAHSEKELDNQMLLLGGDGQAEPDME